MGQVLVPGRLTNMCPVALAKENQVSFSYAIGDRQFIFHRCDASVCLVCYEYELVPGFRKVCAPSDL